MGIWLEPRTGIGMKRVTFLIYLNHAPEGAGWATDIYVDPGTYAGRAPAGFNKGLIFIPATDTWHGFIDYAGPEWRSRHELCFPEPLTQ
jgi:hypothetical protein